MLDLLPRPILALDLGDVFTLILFLIGLTGWIIQAAVGKNKGQKAPGGGAKPQRPARPADERLQNEIESFLREVTGRPQQPKPAEPSKDVVAPPVVDDRPARQKTVRREVPKAKERPRPQTPKAMRQPEPAPTRTTANRPQVGSDDLGRGLEKHVHQYMDENRPAGLESHHLQTGVAGSVSEHLGSFTAAPQATAPTATAPAPATARQVVALLRNPSSVRQAILLNELLSPPKALRQK